MADLPFNWRAWIAECVSRGIPADAMKVVLQEQGLALTEVEKEIQEAFHHPYMLALTEANSSLRKREWLLMLYDAKHRKIKKYGSKILKKKKLPTFKEFQKKYYYENTPVLFQGAVKDWKALDWTFDSIKEKVGNPVIEVVTNRSHDPRYEQNTDKYKTPMHFHEFIDKVVAAGRSNDIYLTGNNYGKSFEALKPLYDELGILGDGWLDMQKLSGDMFLWIGPAGTITNAHHDLRDNLFVQIHGRKKFRLVPALQVPYIYNKVHVFSEMNLLKPDVKMYPEFANATPIDVIVNPGDCLYVPVGWWHAVESLDNSISFSSCNINLEDKYYERYPRITPSY